MRNALLLLSILLCLIALGGENEDLISRQFAEYYVRTSAHESTVKRNLKTMRADGTWEDIDYASQRRGNWPTRTHLNRLAEMAAVYADPSSGLYQDEALRQAVLNGLDHWIERDYQNPNWYNGRIGVPYRLGSALLLMGDAVPSEMLIAAQPILCRSELGMTGQNKVWCAGIGIMKGVLYKDQQLLRRAVEEVWSELRVSTGEGIQPDWSFHQHGPQQQFGNYGKSFGDDMVQWASVLRGTEYALAGEKLEILRRYLLEGPSWILWNGRMDLSGCGRQVDRGCQQRKGGAILRQLDSMKMIDPPFAAAYVATEQRIGFKPFWRSEMGVQRQPGWYASIKMSSTRVIGSESCNSENMLGLHLGDGVLFTHVDGREYEDIMPLWDWKRLPGTTCDQGLEELTPSTLKGYGGSDFAGVIGHGDTGVAAMIYKRGKLSAQKSWFFFGDRVVCLGAGISGQTRGPVYTSIEQAWLKGGVRQEKNIVEHNGMIYQVLEGTPKVESGEVKGNWRSIFPTRSDGPVTGNVFSIWIDHGISPKNGSYAYMVFPVRGHDAPGDMVSVVENSVRVQAVSCGGRTCAVFYEAGALSVDGVGRVAVSGPCLLIMDAERMSVADPMHRLKSLDINVNGRAHQVDLPQGDESGNQVEIL